MTEPDEGSPPAERAVPDGAPERRLTDLLARFDDRQLRLGVGVLALAAALVAWVFRFVQDDAFITFRYSRNLARGNGLVFNVGQKVEGYTNFLWTWLMAIPERQGWSAPMFSIVVGLLLLIVTVFVAHAFANVVVRDRRLAFLATVVLVANMSFVGYGTGGLETMLQTLLVTGVGALVLEPPDGPRAHQLLRRVGAGVLGALACLTRLDSAALVGTWFLIVLVLEWRGDRDGRVPRVLTAGLALGVPMVAILTPWLVWKYGYYGSILPNTLTAKSGGFVIPFLYGVFYLVAFFASYLAFLLIGRFRKRRAELFSNPTVRIAAVPVLVWFLYTCVVGADFMEYRFMVPIIPILVIAAAFLLDRYVNVRSQVVLCAVLLFASGLHMIVPNTIPYPVLVFKELNHWPTESKTAWKGIGDLLHREFPGGERAPGQPVIAVQPLGVIGYYSDLPTVDMLGLADREIARDGLQIPIYYPGHVRMATVPQLVDKKVNLILGLPTYGDVDPSRRSMRLSELAALYSTADLKQLPKDASVLEVPLTPEKVMFVIELRPNAKVDALVESGDWKRIPIERTCKDSDLNVLTRVLAEKTCDGL